MCGIAGFISLDGASVPNGDRKLWAMSQQISHRGPDGESRHISVRGNVGLAHRRLAIIDLSDDGAQPMHGPDGKVIVFNGEIYNYIELRRELSSRWTFRTSSDTEVLLAAFTVWGADCLSRLRGMFAFAVYDDATNEVFCARDPFGIKPFYYAETDGVFYFASEAKALMPVLPQASVDSLGLSEYLTFQHPISERTLFEGVRQLAPGKALRLTRGRVDTWQYWEIRYTETASNDPTEVAGQLRSLIDDSISMHLRSDVPVGSYLSGGVDSGLTTILAARHELGARKSFHGKFTQYPGYDESHYAELVARDAGCELFQIDITAEDFRQSMERVIYHLDQPVAGPGSFPQYMVSKLASQHLKVVIGGQGGDEIFGGYARYFIGYFEAALKSAIQGDESAGGPSLSDLAPNVGVLREYTPLLKQFWSQGLFDAPRERYFRLIDRSSDLAGEITPGVIDHEHVLSTYNGIFDNPQVMDGDRPLERMLHVDFKCLLPALLHVEDRMSMAHGVESRVPFLDVPLVDYVASVPTQVKFEGGRMKQMLRRAYGDILPTEIMNRRDKMGFPVPLKEWWAGELKDYVHDIFGSRAARERAYLDSNQVLRTLSETSRFSRKTWGLLSLELWHRTFIDDAATYRRRLDEAPPPVSQQFA